MIEQSKLIMRLKRQPRHSNTLRDFKDVIDSIYKSFKDGGQDVVTASGFDKLSKAVTETYEKLNVLEQRNRKIVEGFGVTTLRAAQLSQKFDTLGLSIGVNTDKLKQYAVELKKIFPGQAAYLSNTNSFTKALGKQNDMLRNQIGLSAEQNASFITNQKLMLGGTKKTNEQMIDEIAEFSSQLRTDTGYEGAFGDIMESIAGLNAETAAVFGKSGTKNLAAAAIGAKKLGTELNKILATGDNFLDVEQAISKELSLQLLGGKSLNVSAIQQARLTGDAAALTTEITTFLENNGELMKSNAFFLQEAAEASGFSKDQLLEMYAQLKLNNDLEAAGVGTKEAQVTEMQKLIDKENELRRARIAAGEKDVELLETVTDKEKYLADLRSKSTQITDKTQQDYTAQLNKGGEQIDRVASLMNQADKAVTIASTNATKVIAALNDSEFVKELIGIGGVIASLQSLINPSATLTVTGPGETKDGKDLFIPAGGGDTVISGEFGAFTMHPGDDILAAPNIRQAGGGGSASAVIAALSKMAFHVTNVFDGDKIKSSLEIRQGQTLNNINNIA